MITYVNKTNADQYSFLYSQASEELRTHDGEGNPVEYGDMNALIGFSPITLTEDTYVQDRFYVKNLQGKYELCNEPTFSPEKEYFSSDDISSLDEYFSYIVQLNAINRRYTILPLDEDVFTIDTNTRVITVPDSFKKNGISVQGDEVAEIVYFKINRFFDATDLDKRDIYIQWRTEGKDEEGNPIEGVSVPWVKDVESEPGYIIFGWPLSSKITNTAGTVHFAVRFYEYKDKKLTYSLSTLTQTATIKPSLDFNLLDIIADKSKIDDSTGLINDRFENTELNNGAVKAEEPVITVELPTHLDLDIAENGFREKPVQVSVQAMAPDAGQISYTWKKYSIKPENLNDKLPMEFEITMAKTKDQTREDGKLYFQQTKTTKPGEGPDSEPVTVISYILYTGSLDPNAEEYPLGGVFERFSTGTIDGVGKYYVTITNRVRNSTKTIDSKILYVLQPVVPTITKDLKTREILVPEKTFKITLKADSTISDAGTKTYKWFKKAPGEVEFEEILEATNESYTIEGSAEEAPETGAVGDGIYKVEITNHLNKEIAVIESGECRVTHLAAQPDIEYSQTEDIFKLQSFLDDPELSIGLTGNVPAASGENCQRLDEDSITYQWYTYRAGLNADPDKDEENAEAGKYEITGEDRILEGETQASFRPEKAGVFFCNITNTYNGIKASRNSRFFKIQSYDL